MAVIQYLSGVPVSLEELRNKFSTGALKKSDFKSTTKSRKLIFRNGITDTSKLSEHIPAPKRKAYKPIKLGQALGVKIIGGNTRSAINPKRKKQVVITSQIKCNLAWGKAAPRMLNVLKDEVKANQELTPGAADQGGALLYYTPSLTTDPISFKVSVAADNMNQEILDEISGFLDASGKFPLFAPIADWLLVGSQFIQVAGKLINGLFEKGPFLEDEFVIDLDRNILHGPLALVEDEAHFQDYKVALVGSGPKSRYTLVKRDNPRVEYNGTKPFLFLDINGEKINDYKDYLPQVAASDVIQKFHGNKSGEFKSAEQLLEMASIFSDFNYYNKANKITKEIKHLEDNGSSKEELANAKARLKSFSGNIQSDTFLALLKS